MGYFDNISSFDNINDLRIAYRERTDNSMPLQVCQAMSKLMKQYSLTFDELAALVEEHDGLAGVKIHLESSEA